jgi:hypothetical protein
MVAIPVLAALYGASLTAFLGAAPQPATSLPDRVMGQPAHYGPSGIWINAQNASSPHLRSLAKRAAEEGGYTGIRIGMMLGNGDLFLKPDRSSWDLSALRDICAYNARTGRGTLIILLDDGPPRNPHWVALNGGESWPDKLRPPRAVWPAMRRAIQEVIDVAHSYGGKVEFSMGNEPEGGNRTSPAQYRQWHEMLQYLLVENPLDFRGRFVWSAPAKWDGATQWHFDQAFAAPYSYLDRLDGFSFNCYVRVPPGTSPDEFGARLHHEAQTRIDWIRAIPRAATKPLMIPEFGASGALAGQTRSNDFAQLGLYRLSGRAYLRQLPLVRIVEFSAYHEDDASHHQQWGLFTRAGQPTPALDVIRAQRR